MSLLYLDSLGEAESSIREREYEKEKHYDIQEDKKNDNRFAYTRAQSSVNFAYYE